MEEDIHQCYEVKEETLRRITVFFFVGFLLSCSAHSEHGANSEREPSEHGANGFFVWEIDGGPRVIFPTIEDKSPEAILAQYAKHLNSHPGYKAIISANYSLPSGKAKFFVTSNQNDKRPRILVMANELATQSNHLGIGDIHLDRVFSQAGGIGYVLPLGLEVILDDNALLNFQKFLAANFDALVAGGGADVDPSLYGEDNLASFPTSRDRDAMEIKHIKFWIEQTNKVFIGICRGQQIGAVALGFSLIQDIHSELPQLSIFHGGGDHRITFADLSNPLARILEGQPFYALSTHHQAVDFDMVRKGVRAIAYTEDIVEAMSSEDERILMLQFHPESTPPPAGPIIVAGMVKHIMRMSRVL